ncbi:MAG: CDP-alcohol phosphatidyltransferase family protein [Granulosicoccus sp.]
MLDKHIVPRIKPLLASGARRLHCTGISANQVTVAGFFVGMLCVPAMALGQPLLALICLLTNRIADGLDGELARLDSPSDAGSFLDITLDFIFYASFPLGFALHHPSSNALPAAFLIASFVGTGASFLAFASQAEKHSIQSRDFAYKGLYYLDGLAEGTETIVCFALMCLLPAHFALLAWTFAGICLLTTINRVYSGYQTLNAQRSAGRDKDC